MQSTTSAITVLLVLLSLVYKSSAIQCYYCNSANNSACLDPNEIEEEIRGRIIPVVDCAVAIPQPISVKFFCRKIVQTIYHTRRENDVRITRGCGWMPSEKACYRADNSDHLETVCQCFSDHCNSGDLVSPDTAVALFLLLSSVLYFYR
ncbi:uncharacterized protein LOC133525098 [Cydia pomonella]|uniref:uncharacterized protein LOC133525098 n=1 Tax=Cydia pomonella TaxID=82600 RepID=UPI002ADD3F35|nr:uncharacterized protein LOC133525098 [Cydia pomonella]